MIDSGCLKLSRASDTSLANGDIAMDSPYTTYTLMTKPFCWIRDYGLLPDYISIKFEDLWKLCPTERGTVYILGNLIETPRFTRSYGVDYAFAGTVSEGYPLPDILVPLKKYIDNTFGNGGKFNVLVNWYPDGHSYIGKHSDDERQLVPDSPIISLSLGAERKFRIRRKGDKPDIILDLPLVNRKLVMMGGKMQKFFTHEIPKISGKKGSETGPRINITFRRFM